VVAMRDEALQRDQFGGVVLAVTVALLAGWAA
jgi:hypothetical protein